MVTKQDKNLIVKKEIKKDDLVWRDARSEPFAVCGVYYEGDRFRRLPEEVARATNAGVLFRHANTAGGRVRFRTDSPTVAISARYQHVERFAHFSLTGTAGFDLYAKDEGEDIYRYRATFAPPLDMTEGYESRAELGSRAMREVTVNMPMYSDISELRIGLADGAALLPPEPFTAPLPIVFYGNSITQGACCSRPGTAFATAAARELGCDLVNLGFSGSGRAEPAIAEYVAGLDMQIFVYDYDHNAPNPEYLEQTHERMFRMIRERHPLLPVVMLSMTSIHLTPEMRARRRDVVRATYERARAAGDVNVYFIDGGEIFGALTDSATVEGVHPNDLGHMLITKALVPLLADVLRKQYHRSLT